MRCVFVGAGVQNKNGNFVAPRDFFQAGANMIVSGTAVVKSDNPRETINYLRRTVDEAIQKCNLER